VLSTFRWPGNIRQLENTLFRAVVLAESDTVGLSEFPQIAAQIPAQPEAAPRESEQPLVPNEGHAELPLAALEIEPHAAMAAALPAPSANALPLLDAAGEVRPLEELEAELIRYAITHYRGQMSEVARRLQIGRSTLYRKLEVLGLNTEQHEADSEGVAR
jgi:DNA-binding NtrC family response regulator